MKTKQIFILILVLSLSLSLQAEDGIQILTPSTYCGTYDNQLTIVGTTSAPIVEVYLNGARFGDFGVEDSYFHIPLKFGYGLNEVTVTAVYSGMVETTENSARIEILCGPENTRKHLRIYPEHLFHEKEDDLGCQKCHSREKARESESESESRSYCSSCHGNVGYSKGDNFKMSDKDCALCHTEDGDTNNEKIIKQPPFEKCYSCHTDKIESFDQEYVHGPVAGGSCAICHDPHGSGFENSLKNAEEILCFTCHEFTREFKNMSDQHKPFAEGKCGRCHDPHATANRWVLVKSTETVCLECHDPESSGMEFHMHPFNIEPKRPLTQDLQLSDNGKLECLSCHCPHATDSEHLLRTSQQFTCKGCHSEKM